MMAERVVDRVQRRTVRVLALATVLGGLGVGASISAGALLITDVTGNEAISGLGSTLSAVGAAFAGIPLARLAARSGRRVALALGSLVAAGGALLVIAAASGRTAVALFVGLAVLGIASAVQLQSRFAATDLAAPRHRARDLSLVVWSITIGAVVGPNLIGPGAELGASWGVAPLAGVFLFVGIAQLLASAVVWFGLRPDPLRLAREREVALHEERPVTSAPEQRARVSERSEGRSGAQVALIGVIALSHAVMVGIMAMTPIHLTHHGGSVTLVGLTISLHIAGMYALSPVFGALAERFGAMPVIWSGLAVLGLAASGTGIWGGSVMIVQVALVLLGLGWSMVTVAGSALLTDLTPASIRPRRQGQSDTAMNAAGAGFGAFSGLLFALGGFSLVSAVSGALLIGAVVLGIRVLNGRQR